MITTKQLGFGYSRKRPPLFDGLDLELPAGTICGMLGANGAGKSTLLKILAGLIFPQQGSCDVLGYTPGARLPSFLADIFLLPEEIHTPALNAEQYASLYGSLYPRFDRAQFFALLNEFALPLDRKASTFSHGQKKKFLLAFGIATNTRLLIMDEPTNGLDIPSKSQFRKVLINHFDPARSFIISTHQVHDLQSLIDSVLVIAEGKILLHASLETVAQRLSVEVEHQSPQHALFFEQTLDGYRVLRENQSGVDSSVDLSLLFGFVTGEKARAQQLFASGGAA
jgi:ABC-2 type transport system ATP-binding protein